MKKLKAIRDILLGRYTIISRENTNLIVDTGLKGNELKRAACLFFKEAYSLK